VVSSKAARPLPSLTLRRRTRAASPCPLLPAYKISGSQTGGDRLVVRSPKSEEIGWEDTTSHPKIKVSVYA
jgi:hypothetical protein